MDAGRRIDGWMIAAQSVRGWKQAGWRMEKWDGHSERKPEEE